MIINNVFLPTVVWQAGNDFQAVYLITKLWRTVFYKVSEIFNSLVTGWEFYILYIINRCEVCVRLYTAYSFLNCCAKISNSNKYKSWFIYILCSPSACALTENFSGRRVWITGFVWHLCSIMSNQIKSNQSKEIQPNQNVVPYVIWVRRPW